VAVYDKRTVSESVLDEGALNRYRVSRAAAEEAYTPAYSVLKHS
jgi:hypothetical protein